MKHIILFLLCLCLPLHAQLWQLPAANQGYWTPNTPAGTPGIGVPGGIDQYREGGANERLTSAGINVKNSPYFAAGNNNETTGDTTGGTTTLTVADATGFTAGNYIRYGMQSIHTLTITGGATQSTPLRVFVGIPGAEINVGVDVLNGDSPSVVAGKIRATSVAGGRIAVSGSGADVIYTAPNAGPVIGTYIQTTAGTTSSNAVTRTGTVYTGRIASVAGNIITLEAAASETMTGALVQHDDAPSIAAAMAAAPANSVVYLPAGTYRISTTITAGLGDSDITLRGAGGTTILYGSMTNSMLSMGGAAEPVGAWARQVVSGTRTKGSTVLTLADATHYNTGNLATIFLSNEEDNTRILAGAAPTWSSAGFPWVRKMTVRIMGKTGNNITIDPPMPWDATAYDVKAETANTAHPSRIGVEDLAVTFDEANHPYSAIGLGTIESCWVYNVTAPEWKKNSQSGSVIGLGYAYRCEVRFCDFRTLDYGAYSDDGAIAFGAISSCLIVDNILHSFDQGIYNNGNCVNNAYLYNYMGGSTETAGHTGGNVLELWEGNRAGSIHLDGYHGGGSHMTWFRNHLYYGLSVKRFFYYMAVAGNISGNPTGMTGGNSYGYPNIGNGDFTGTANHFTGDPHVQWLATATLTTRTSNTEGVITLNNGLTLPGTDGIYITTKWGGSYQYARYQMGITSFASGNIIGVSGGFGGSANPADDFLPAEGSTVQVWFGAAGYQEFDLGTDTSATKADNWIWAPGGGAFDNNVADVLPASLAYSAKPAWFGNLPWPPVTPDSPNYAEDLTPSGYRYTTGNDPPTTGNNPVITITSPASPPTIAAGASQAFTATATDTEDGSLTGASIVWRNGATTIGTGTSITPTFSTAGTFTIYATATDSDDNQDSDSMVVTVTSVGSNPVATITSPASPPTISAGTTQAFTATATDADDGSLSGASVVWKIGATTLGTGLTLNHLFSTAGSFTVTVTATDSNSNTHTDDILVTVTGGGGSSSITTGTLNVGTLRIGP